MAATDDPEPPLGVTSQLKAWGSKSAFSSITSTRLTKPGNFKIFP